jgi:hypothetical protein
MQALVGAPPLDTPPESVPALYEPGYMLAGYLQQGRLPTQPPNPVSLAAPSSGSSCFALDPATPTLVEEDWSVSAANNPLGQMKPHSSPPLTAPVN